ncbi:MAG: hypothetical protein ACQESC_04095 [Nanobdellota archaeon]
MQEEQKEQQKEQSVKKSKTGKGWKYVKKGLTIGAMTGMFFLGEYLSPVSTIRDTITYYNISAEDGFPQDFRDLNKVVVINEKNRAEVYFGNTTDSVFHPVREDYHTKRDIGKEIDSYIKQGMDKTDSIISTYKDRWF